MGQAIRKERRIGSAPKLDVRDASGATLRTATLAPEVFAVEPNVPLMHQVVNAQLAARRSGTQSTKTRSEVRGGGAKPWRQKGTGRARAGSMRSPIFVGGGVAHGPKPRSYAQRTPKKMIAAALRCALSDRINEEKIIVVGDFGLDTPKTKAAIALLTTLGATGSVLLVLGDDDESVFLSYRNVSHVHVVHESELNVFDVLRSDYIVFAESSVPTGASNSQVAKSEAGE